MRLEVQRKSHDAARWQGAPGVLETPSVGLSSPTYSRRRGCPVAAPGAARMV